MKCGIDKAPSVMTEINIDLSRIIFILVCSLLIKLYFQITLMLRKYFMLMRDYYRVYNNTKQRKLKTFR